MQTYNMEEKYNKLKKNDLLPPNCSVLLKLLILFQDILPIS